MNTLRTLSAAFVLASSAVLVAAGAASAADQVPPNPLTGLVELLMTGSADATQSVKETKPQSGSSNSGSSDSGSSFSGGITVGG